MPSPAEPHDAGRSSLDSNTPEAQLMRAESRGAESGESPKKKQKRNKPTLSCIECVERKTKVRSPFASSRRNLAAKAECSVFTDTGFSFSAIVLDQYAWLV
jgi:hypothetical protein